MSTATLSPSQMDFAELCASRAQMLADGEMMVCDVVDELQAVADYTGLVAEIGQDGVQALMSETIATAWLVPELSEPDELDEVFEREIMLRAADLVREWELADPRDRHRHTGEPRPVVRPETPRRAAYTPPQATIDAFWYVVRLGNPDYLARWLANHPTDAPELFKLWKSKPC